MKTKLILVAFIAVFATACVPKTIIKTEYVEKKVPVNSVPQPPVVQKPDYSTPKLTPEDRKDIGKVTQAVVTDSKLKDGYIQILELIINSYKKAADESELQTRLVVPGVTDKDAAPKP